jgi:uncharacterized membrane protein YdbT with pleckstrin-like domain
MAFPRSHLNDNEEIVLEMHPHWWFLVPRGAILVVSLAVAGWALTLGDSGPDSGSVKTVKIIVAIGVAVALLAFIQQIVKWVSTDFVVTTERCIYRSGVISKSGVEIPLDRVNTVFFNQGIFERIIRAGDIGIESAGENSRQEFSDIYDPVSVQTTIYRQMEQYENRRQDRLGHVVRGANAPAAGQLTVAEQIEKLHELRERGAMTDAEFEAQKAKLLGP